MKKMFWVLVLALSLSLSVSAQQAPATKQATVTTQVTTTPHVSAPVQVLKPVTVTAQTTLPGKVTEPTATAVQSTTPISVPSTPVLSTTTLDTSKGKSTAAELTQADSLPPVPVNPNSGTPWGFVGIVVVIVGIILYFTFNQDEDEPATTNAPPVSEPEDTTEDVSSVTTKRTDSTKEESTK